MDNEAIKEFYIDEAFSLLRKNHHWITRAELRHWELKDLKELVKRLEGKKK